MSNGASASQTLQKLIDTADSSGVVEFPSGNHELDSQLIISRSVTIKAAGDGDVVLRASSDMVKKNFGILIEKLGQSSPAKVEIDGIIFRDFYAAVRVKPDTNDDKQKR